MIGETGERKSAVATPDGKSRKKKKKKGVNNIMWIKTHAPQGFFFFICGYGRVPTNIITLNYSNLDNQVINFI